MRHFWYWSCMVFTYVWVFVPLDIQTLNFHCDSIVVLYNILYKTRHLSWLKTDVTANKVNFVFISIQKVVIKITPMIQKRMSCEKIFMLPAIFIFLNNMLKEYIFFNKAENDKNKHPPPLLLLLATSSLRVRILSAGSVMAASSRALRQRRMRINNRQIIKMRNTDMTMGTITPTVIV